MLANSREEIVETFDALNADLDRALKLSFDALTTPERMAVLQRCETLRRRLPALEHSLINQISAQADATELGAKLSSALANRLRITCAEASRRIGEAADLGERTALTGEPLPPLLAATAAAQRAGHLGAAHAAVIRGFTRQLPDTVDIETRQHAEAKLAQLAGNHRPDELHKLATKLTDCLNPDGNYTDAERARRRGLVLGKQEHDGMSPLRGWLTPELRATLEAVLAKLAAPGMANPNDELPTVDGQASEQAAQRDTRTATQRNHDALTAALRALLASRRLGQHNGLPATVIVSTTLRELASAAGQAITGGGSRLPMNDVIRLASHAHHYLAIFDNAKAIGLYHTKRLASPGQRIVLYARDRGCTKPGCDAPAYHCQAHHVRGWQITRHTDIDDLTLACGIDNRLVEKGWVTRRNGRGETEWIPPPHLDHGQPRTNAYHHPEKLLRQDEDSDT